MQEAIGMTTGEAARQAERGKVNTQPSDSQKEANSTGGVERNNGEGTEESEPRPVGSDFFGNIYNQFKGKAKEAYNLLSRLKSGIAINVFERNDIGGIALVWGDDKGGLYHIVKKHIIEHKDFANVDEALEVIQDVLNNGSISRENADKVNIDWNGYRVSVRKQTRDEKGNVVEKGNWVVTAFDRTRTEKEKTPSGETLTTPSSNRSQTADGVTLPSNGASIGKDSKASDTKQENAEENLQEAIGTTTGEAAKQAERGKVNTEPSVEDELK